MNYTMVAEKVDPEDWATPSTNELVKRALNPVYKERKYYSSPRCGGIVPIR